jgi:hypothetical protein
MSTLVSVFANGAFGSQAGEDGLCPLHPPAPVLQGNQRRIRHHPAELLVRARGAPLPCPGEVGQEGRRWRVSSDGLRLHHYLLSLRLCSGQVRMR